MDVPACTGESLISAALNFVHAPSASFRAECRGSTRRRTSEEEKGVLITRPKRTPENVLEAIRRATSFLCRNTAPPLDSPLLRARAPPRPRLHRFESPATFPTEAVLSAHESQGARTRRFPKDCGWPNIGLSLELSAPRCRVGTKGAGRGARSASVILTTLSVTVSGRNAAVPHATRPTRLPFVRRFGGCAVF